MSAVSLAKQAYSVFNKEKPHSSITEWVELLTAANTADEAYDGIPELVDSISIQATGPGEASRALRKKLKHGNSHQQYRALVILRALVENGGQKFQTSFADSHMIEAIKMLATEPTTDPKVKKKLISVLGAWHSQFKDDPSMSGVASLYNLVKPAAPQRRPQPAPPPPVPAFNRPEDDFQFDVDERKSRDEIRRMEEESRREDKRRAKEAKEAAKRKALVDEEERRRKAKAAASGKPRRKPFNYEEEKPQILTAIANASTSSNNLVNAITLVNTENDSLTTNERVQECLQKAKVSRKQIVRYVQLVENEEMIGTLIETNDRIIAALETYDTLIKPTVTEQDVQDVQNNLAAVKIQDTELGKLQEKQRAAVQRSIGRGGRSVHPDLQELSFGNLGADQRNLPPPIRPTSARTSSSDEDRTYRRGSLSDYSDYESSDEEAHNRASGSGSARAKGYQQTSDDELDARRDPKQSLLDDAEGDPFADPFLDQEEEEGVRTPGIKERKLVW